MNKRFLICSISITVCGVALFMTSIFLINEKSIIFGWCIGLGAALLVLGLGFLIRYFYDQINMANQLYPQEEENDRSMLRAKERAGYLSGKIMMLLLCIHILILKNMEVDPILLCLVIALVVIQYLLNLILQLYYINRK